MASKIMFHKKMGSSIFLIVGLAIILIVLAVLQYRWSGQVSEAERERMQIGLTTSVEQFRLRFNDELHQLARSLSPDNGILLTKDWSRYAQHCTASLSTNNSNLIANIYLWLEDEKRQNTFSRLDSNTQRFQITSWPEKLANIKERYEGAFRQFSGVRPLVWVMHAKSSSLIYALAEPEPFARAEGAPMFHLLGFVIVELHQSALREEIFPELAQRYFAGSAGFNYRIAIVTDDVPEKILYRSNPDLTPASLAAPDAKLNLFEEPPPGFGPGRENRPQNPNNAAPPFRLRGGGPPPRFRENMPGPGAGPGMRPPEPGQPGRGRNFRLILHDEGDANWFLLARHRAGSLESAVALLRRRNLSISFGILLLLAISMSLIIVAARRAHWLAQLQIEFVTRVSHELRTPLAVICSAGENLADGIVADSDKQVRQYGELICDESSKLKGMVEQILQYASVRSGRNRYQLRPTGIHDVIQDALEQTRSTIEVAGFKVEKDVASDLPMVNVDAKVLSQCIQNLIQNAVKYSSQNRWLSVRAASEKRKDKILVNLMVEDKGLGIDPSDLPHIFEPFYRGETAKNAQIHGAGLGLFMTKEAVEAMGGNIRVKSVPGQGSLFTLTLPAVPNGGILTSNNNPHVSL